LKFQTYFKGFWERDFSSISIDNVLFLLYIKDVQKEMMMFIIWLLQWWKKWWRKWE